MNRHSQGQQFTRGHPHEVDMHDDGLEWVPMHITHYRLLGEVITNPDFDNAGVKRFLLCCMQQSGLLQGKRHRVTVSSINNRWNFSFMTQAAARPLPHVLTEFRDDAVMYCH